MEKFKKIIQFRFQLCTMYMCSGTMLYFLLQRLTENVPDFSKGMLTGLLVGGDLLALVYMIRCFVLLRDEKKLKEAYIKSKDERNNEIDLKGDNAYRISYHPDVYRPCNNNHRLFQHYRQHDTVR